MTTITIHDMEVLSIIPARGNSKELPKKNIRFLAGKPLIEYSITHAKQSKLINRIIVSTDNEKIAKISKSLRAEVPFLRPKKISKDSTPLIDVIKHTIEYLEKNENYIPDIIVVLQPTSPIRHSKKIDESIHLLMKTHCNSVLSVAKVETHPSICFWNDNKYLKPYDKNFEKLTIRQTHKPLYHPTGSLYTFWLKTLKKYDSIYGPKIKPLTTSNSSENLDINELFDFFVSEMTIKYWNKYSKKFGK